jgi:hypothetical protein
MAEDGNIGNVRPQNAPSRAPFALDPDGFIAAAEKFRLGMFVFMNSLICSAHP